MNIVRGARLPSCRPQVFLPSQPGNTHVKTLQLFNHVSVNPFGFALALVGILCVPLSLAVLISGKVWRINWYRISPNRVVVGVLAFFVLAWGFKIIRHLALNG